MASSRMLALLGLLAIAGYQNRDKLGELLGKATGGASDALGSGGGASGRGALGGMLGSMLGGNGSGTDLPGGLGDLIEKFTGAGQADKAKTWVTTGPNQQLAEDELETVLGEDTIGALTQQTGLSRPELLSRLRTILPDAVDKMTPEGRLPTVV